MRAVWRYRVGLDGPEEIGLSGDPVAVGNVPGSDGIEFWAEHDDAQRFARRTFLVVGTGHRIPDAAVYVGTAPRTPEGLVWHLYEIPGDAP